MSDQQSSKPRRCLVTKLGLVTLALAAMSLIVILAAQRIKTGSFERGDGFVLGPTLGNPLLYGTPAALALLVVGGIVDAVRFGRRKRKADGTPR